MQATGASAHRMGSKSSSMQYERVKSRKRGPSPAMLPSAQTACSRTSAWGHEASSMKMGTAPLSMTTRVCSEVPEEMLVSAHVASSSCSAEDQHKELACAERLGLQQPSVQALVMYECRVVEALAELYEARHRTRSDNLGNWRVPARKYQCHRSTQ